VNKAAKENVSSLPHSDGEPIVLGGSCMSAVSCLPRTEFEEKQLAKERNSWGKSYRKIKKFDTNGKRGTELAEEEA
jgi:hypothetical protein